MVPTRGKPICMDAQEHDADEDQPAEENQNMEVEPNFIVCLEFAEGKVTRPPTEFRQRPAYVELESLGLTKMVPLKNCGVYYHKSTSQWHTKYGDSNSAPKWGPDLRSEKRALLMALISLWKWYAGITNASEDSQYVTRLQEELHATPF